MTLRISLTPRRDPATDTGDRFHGRHHRLLAFGDAGRACARRFFQRALQDPTHPRPRVTIVDGNPSYPKVVAELKQERKLGRRCRSRTCPYLNNNLEQDHRAIRRCVQASQAFRSFDGAWRTNQGYEVLHMIRKGEVRWSQKGDVVGRVLFVNETPGLKTG